MYKFFLVLALTGPLSLAAQRSYVVAQQHPQASDQHPGTEQQPLRSIQAAARLAQPGDTVLVHAGIYRERVAPPRGGSPGLPITYLAARGESVVVKASEIWQPDWQALADRPGVYEGSFATVDFALKPAPPQSFFPTAATHYNPYLDTLRAVPSGDTLSLGQVFVEGNPLTQVGRLADLYRLPGSWMVKPDRSGAYVHLADLSRPPAELLVELTTRRRCFAPYRRGLGYIHVEGFTFEHGATNFPQGFWKANGSPQAGIVSCRGGHHWRIEGCTIRYGQSIGLDIGNEGAGDADGLGQPRPKGTGYHLILNNVITDHGCGGIEGIGSTETQIIGNRIERNNRLGFTAPEIGGIKLHVFERGLIADNLIRGNYGYGLWLDNIWTDSRVTRNVIIGNQGTGLFIELGAGPLLVDHNLIALTHHSLGLNGDGVYSHDASGVTFAHNLVYGNAHFGLWVHVATDRKYYVASEGIESESKVLCQSSNWRIVNNWIWGNHGGTLALPAVSSRSHSNQCDHNLLAGPFDPLTSETSAAGLAPPTFRLLPNKGRISPDSLYAALHEQLALPAHANRQLLPYFTLAEWRSLTGHDTASRHPLVLKPNLSEAQLQLMFMIDRSPLDLSAPVIAGIDRDFFGEPLGPTPVVGPFQTLRYLPALTPEPKPFRGPYDHVRSSLYPSNHFYLGHWPRIPFPHATTE